MNVLSNTVGSGKLYENRFISRYGAKQTRSLASDVNDSERTSTPASAHCTRPVTAPNSAASFAPGNAWRGCHAGKELRDCCGCGAAVDGAGFLRGRDRSECFGAHRVVRRLHHQQIEGN